MKKLLFAFLLFIGINSQSQNLRVSFGYNADAPFKSFMPKMSTNHGMDLGLMFRMPKTPLWFAANTTFGSFANQTLKQEYAFTDGTITKMDVNYSSNMTKVLFGFHLDIGNAENAIVPYLRMQGGINYMNSRVYIGDPEDEDGCEALVNKVTFANVNSLYSVGGGAMVYLNRLCKFKESSPKNYLDFGFSYLGGSPAQYVNVKYMTDGEAHHGTSGTTPAPTTGADPDTRDMNAKFVNVSTSATHEHKVAEVYSSPFKMWNLRIGYTISF